MIRSNDKPVFQLTKSRKITQNRQRSTVGTASVSSKSREASSQSRGVSSFLQAFKQSVANKEKQEEQKEPQTYDFVAEYGQAIDSSMLQLEAKNGHLQEHKQLP